MSQEHLPIAPPLASALQGVKLRSAPLCPHRDEDAGAATLTASATLAAALQTEREHNARLRSVDLESWYDSISDQTFKTIFLPLAPNEARCIAQEYHRKITRAASGATQDISSYVHDTEDDTCLLQLHARISDALAALGGHGECQALRGAWCRCGFRATLCILLLPSSPSPTLCPSSAAFVKLSSRSPKDSRTCEQRAFKRACDIIRGAQRYVDHFLPFAACVLI